MIEILSAGRCIACDVCVKVCPANVFNAGIVLGPPAVDSRTIDLAAARGTLRTNGGVAGEGRGSDVGDSEARRRSWVARGRRTIL